MTRGKGKGRLRKSNNFVKFLKFAICVLNLKVEREMPNFPLRCQILFETSMSNFNLGYKTSISNVKIKTNLKL